MIHLKQEEKWRLDINAACTNLGLNLRNQLQQILSVLHKLKEQAILTITKYINTDFRISIVQQV